MKKVELKKNNNNIEDVFTTTYELDVVIGSISMKVEMGESAFINVAL